MIIDFSAHDTWAKCPAMWFEKYVNRKRKHWPSAQRDDALALGSLVHEGLRIWQEKHVVAIPDGVIAEVTPTKDCYDLALELVYGYAKTYPEEWWPLIMCEEPLRFPLIVERVEKLSGWQDRVDLEGLAKIDAYFYVPDYTTVETGLGFMQTLQPGWWIHEYKTKSPFIAAGMYMQSWEMGLQASYQMTALRHHLLKLREAGTYDGERYPYRSVEGVLVNVLEKPKRHVPRRKCQTCEEYYDFATWIPTGTGLYACPTCGVKQKLTPLKEAQPQIPPAYYRICVTRTDAELEHARQEMVQVGQRMQAMAQDGLHSEPWHHNTCVDFRWRKVCDYFGPHKNNVSTLEDPDYEPIPDYRGLVQLEGDAA